jgi:transketolase
MSETPLRDVFGKALAELGHLNPNVVALDADLAGATRSIHFGKAHPERFFNVGIAEANMVSIAAGLSTCGKIPYACTFAFLITLRALDQIRSQVCYPHLNVKLVGTNGGLSGFGDGATHQEVADLAIMRAMPGMTVVVPSDEVTMRQAVLQSADHVGPFYLRVPRVPAPLLHGQDSPFAFGKGIRLREGADVTIVAMGMMVCRAMDAAQRLNTDGIQAEIIEIHTLKPIDAELLASSMSKTGAVVTAEEHSRYGGLYSAVAEVAAEVRPVPMGRVAIEDRFGESGQYDEIMAACGLTADHIAAEAKSAVARKRF